MHLLLITVLALIAAASGDPAILLSGGLISPSFTSAALVAQPAAPVVAPATPVASFSPLAYSSVASVAPVAPAAQVAPVAFSDYKYAYGSSVSYQDYYPVVNSAFSLPYSLPYAYAADWYYRK
ncbi:uncharacterized protein LOC124536486 [Vanessa cardui]|uniref:uncharacterized protein LOC124536486 n=1 Tax=Vanessa cardui TaxID=171605 RepID=UPI001F1321E0|nr:uncharacterized protein LOC124536486 [Vanessa cardui]